MGTQIQADKPIRVGIFKTIRQADQAVEALHQAGFTKDQITVICSDQAKEAHFAEYEHQEPAGSRTPLATTTGGAIRAVLGGLSALVGVVTTGGIGLLAAGAIFASTGALVGGFVGAMTTCGIDNELANYYDQTVEQGKILVAVEDHSERAGQSLNEAERIFAQVGADPIELPEG